MPQESDFNKVNKIERISEVAESTIENQEKKTESSFEKIIPKIDEGKSGNEIASISPSDSLVSQVLSEEKEREKEIEDVMSEGLTEAYMAMSTSQKLEFKKTGEMTAKQINVLLSQIKINMKKILHLLKKWLMLIPGINKYYLEQEAKIKTDKIIKIRNNN